MKKLFGIAAVIFGIVALLSWGTAEPPVMHSIEGTWELQHFYFYENNEVSDTVELAEGYRQVKMYYNGNIMWSRTNVDSVGRFGYGTYEITEDELIENIEYGDINMMRALDTLTQFSFELQLTSDTYSQVTIDAEGNREFSENYKRID